MSNRMVVRGFVVDGSSGLGISGSRVEAWDASKRVRDLVGYARSGEGGAFTMDLDDGQRRALFGEGTATLYFRVCPSSRRRSIRPFWCGRWRPG